MLAEVAERNIIGKAPLHQDGGRLRKHHLTAVCRVGDAGSPMHIETDVVGRAEGTDPRVQPHPGPDDAVGWPRMVHQGMLSLHRCLERVHRSCEDGEEGIALGLDDDTIVFRDGGLDQGVVRLEDRDPVITEGLHQPRRALDIGEEEGDRPRRKRLTSGCRHHTRR